MTIATPVAQCRTKLTPTTSTPPTPSRASTPRSSNSKPSPRRRRSRHRLPHASSPMQRRDFARIYAVVSKVATDATAAAIHGDKLIATLPAHVANRQAKRERDDTDPTPASNDTSLTMPGRATGSVSACYPRRLRDGPMAVATSERRKKCPVCRRPGVARFAASSRTCFVRSWKG